ncbi:hypothetical protein M231_00647 [Tremella mesenterica]|uniref:Uncharacterized protein n=1 Tax=Tremella mesenterica TaxID=5217 RepID=A0A4Q1BV84_TREME|nr:hypothetical protein M231_00647 [Tremella mesenterica]
MLQVPLTIELLSSTTAVIRVVHQIFSFVPKNLRDGSVEVEKDEGNEHVWNNMSTFMDFEVAVDHSRLHLNDASNQVVMDFPKSSKNNSSDTASIGTAGSATFSIYGHSDTVGSATDVSINTVIVPGEDEPVVEETSKIDSAESLGTIEIQQRGEDTMTLQIVSFKIADVRGLRWWQIPDQLLKFGSKLDTAKSISLWMGTHEQPDKQNESTRTSHPNFFEKAYNALSTNVKEMLGLGGKSTIRHTPVYILDPISAQNLEKLLGKSPHLLQNNLPFSVIEVCIPQGGSVSEMMNEADVEGRTRFKTFLEQYGYATYVG